MKRITTLEQNIEDLKKQKKELQITIKELQKMIDINEFQCERYYFEIASAYRDFYDKLTNKDFVLYENYPSINSLKTYLTFGKELFPIHNFGEFNLKELVEIIKHILEFNTGEEFQIKTFGTVSVEVDRENKGCFEFPHISFVIAREKALRPFEDYANCFVNNDSFYKDLMTINAKHNVIIIEATPHYKNSLGISVSTGSAKDKLDAINFYDKHSHEHNAYACSNKKQIFSRNINEKLKTSPGIRSVIDFDINSLDTYIARILISISIYKRNNLNKELTEDDYNHIFDTLYGKKVNITDDIAKDIPKELKYIN